MSIERILSMKDTGEYTLEVMKTATWYNKWLFSLVEPHIQGEVLEVGAGIGNFTELLYRKCNLTAIDINKGYIEKLKRRFSKKVKVGLGDIEEEESLSKVGKKKFDVIICLNVLEHIKNHQQAVSNMYKILKSGGILILLVPAHPFLFSEFDKRLGHYRRYTKTALKSLVCYTNFEIVELRYLNFWAAIGWFLFLKLTGKKILAKKQLSMFDKLGKILLWPEKFVDPPFGLSVFSVAKKR